MALTRVSGFRVAAAGATTVYTGRGRLLGVLLSHAQATVQHVHISDALNDIALIYVDPTRSPIYISFGPGDPTGGKQEGIPFTTSLVVTRGDVEVNVWYVGY